MPGNRYTSLAFVIALASCSHHMSLNQVRMSQKQGHTLQDNSIYTSLANEALGHIGQCPKLLLYKHSTAAATLPAGSRSGK